MQIHLWNSEDLIFYLDALHEWLFPATKQHSKIKSTTSRERTTHRDVKITFSSKKKKKKKTIKNRLLGQPKKEESRKESFGANSTYESDFRERERDND